MAARFVLPVAPDDSDDVVIALETARVQEERADLAEAARWMQKAAVAARKQGRPERAGELSRAAARIVRAPDRPPSGKFERREEVQHVLPDSDDFSEETIVDSVDKLREEDRSASRHVLPKGTPVAPGIAKTDAPVHQTFRVAVRKSLGGKLEVRALSLDEAPGTGEEEALLVPLRSETKLF